MSAISPPRLNRQVLITSRLLEFCTQKEMVLQTGHAPEQWPLVALKELIDKALDASEKAGIAPTIKVVVRTAPSPSIMVTDKRPGIAPETVKAMLDFSARASSKEAHASPTRGAQGNALKTLIAMPFALDGSRSACSILDAAKARFLQMEDCAWLNPHLSLAMDWDGGESRRRPAWRKLLPSDPTPAH